MNKPGYVYILKNESFPGLVKIGMTTQNNVENRVRQMSTGVPTPFEIVYTAKVERPAEIEKALHVYFDQYRFSRNREWFEVDIDKVQHTIWKMDSAVRYRDNLFEAISKNIDFKYEIDSRNSNYILPFVVVFSATMFAISIVVEPDIISAVMVALSSGLFGAMVFAGFVLPVINRYQFSKELSQYKKELSTIYGIDEKDIDEYKDQYIEYKRFERYKQYKRMKRAMRKHSE